MRWLISRFREFCDQLKINLNFNFCWNNWIGWVEEREANLWLFFGTRHVGHPKPLHRKSNNMNENKFHQTNSLIIWFQVKTIPDCLISRHSAMDYGLLMRSIIKNFFSSSLRSCSIHKKLQFGIGQKKLF